MIDSVSVSRSYLYWRNAELATVTLNSVWDADNEEYVEREFESVVVKRVSDRNQSNFDGGVPIRSDEQIFLVAAALVEGNTPKDGDTIEINDEVWVMKGDATVARAGNSVSHYRVACNPFVSDS